MRKDLHVGLAIGGVLLAVLIVWGVVVNHGKQHKQAVTLETTIPAGTGNEIPPAPPAAATDTSTPPAAPAAGSAPAAAPSADGATAPPAAPVAPAVAETKDTNWTALLAGNGTLPPAVDATPAPAAAPASPIVLAVATPRNDPATDARTQATFSPSPVTGGQTVAPADPNTIATSTTPPSGSVVSTSSIQADLTAAPHTHKIAKGETFASISRAVYGDSRYYDQIAQANPKINPNRLRPGTIINLPDAAEVKASSKTEPKADTASASAATSPKKASSSAAVDSQKEYRVVAGDSLYKISMHLYGSGEEVDHIYALNKDKIGPDESKLKLGMVLKIPAPPTVATASNR